MPPDDLPRRTLGRRGRGPAHDAATSCDKLPIALVGRAAGRALRLSRPSMAASHAFERFLHDHGRLLQRVAGWAVVVAHPRHVCAPAAWKRHFGDSWATIRRSRPTRLQDLERYFVARRAVERNEFAQLSIAELRRFRSTRLALRRAADRSAVQPLDGQRRPAPRRVAASRVPCRRDG